MSEEAIRAAAIAHCKATGVDFKGIKHLAMENMRQAIDAYEAYRFSEVASAASRISKIPNFVAMIDPVQWQLICDAKTLATAFQAK